LGRRKRAQKKRKKMKPLKLYNRLPLMKSMRRPKMLRWFKNPLRKGKIIVLGDLAL
jgi:hypothetical protein